MKGQYIYPITCMLIGVVSLFLDTYEVLAILLAVVVLLQLLNKMGKGIALREITAFLYTFTCVLVPIYGYKYFNYNNTIARIWVKYMPVPMEVYYGFSLPAIAFFCGCLTFPIVKDGKEQDAGEGLLAHLNRIKEILKTNYMAGFYLLGLGIVASLLNPVLPTELKFFASLLFFAAFTGLLYLFYSTTIKYKWIMMVGFGAFIFAGAIASGMFTIIAYMGATIFSFFFIRPKISLLSKLGVFLTAMFLLVILQNTKLTYRKYTWRSAYEGNRTELFFKIFQENLFKGSALLEDDAFFPVYVRTNQGYNVALVMRRIPLQQPFDAGNNLSRVILSSVVPRFLWPDKPEAGGKFNMEYYAGLRISGWSTNIGPLGEAYGSFGKYGGILYMLILGLMIRFAYGTLFKVLGSKPLLLLWLPVIFFQVTYSAETDTLQILNSVLKASFFTFLMFKIKPNWFLPSNQLVNSGTLAKRFPVLN